MARPRGFINNWKPRSDTMELVDKVNDIIDSSSILPLTLRQIFYMLVSRHGYDKTEKAYKRLCETMNKARRAQVTSMDSIRDDGLSRKNPHDWPSEQSMINTFKTYAERFRLERQRGQDRHIMVWCEAGGMLPQLADYCNDYGIPVLSSGGFDSVTTKHNFAQEASDFDDVLIFHIGDHDPSGVHMHSSLDEDLTAFVDYYGGNIEVSRLAVVPDQIEEMNLPTAPPKKTDNRAFEGLTTQAEAIDPADLKELVQGAIEAEMDLNIYDEVLAEEEEIKVSLVERLGRL